MVLVNANLGVLNKGNCGTSIQPKNDTWDQYNSYLDARKVSSNQLKKCGEINGIITDETGHLAATGGGATAKDSLVTVSCRFILIHSSYSSFFVDDKFNKGHSIK